MRKKLVFVFLALLLLTTTVSAYSVNPAKWVFYQRNDYEIYPLTFNLEIKNEEDSPITVAVSIIEPKELYSGNEPLPDKSWIQLGMSEITVPAKSSANMPVYIDLPESYEKNGVNISNYNKSYETWLFTQQTDGAGNIRIDYNCRWTIQTPWRYVPLEQRPGYVNPMIAVYIITGIISTIIVISVLFYRRKAQENLNKKKKKPVKSKRKSSKPKPKPSARANNEEMDIFR